MSTAEIAVRAMAVDELDTVLAVESSAFAHTAWSRAGFAAELSQVPDSRWYAVAHDPAQRAEVLGHVGLMAAARDAGTADLTTLAVAPDRRREGIGRLLLQAALAEATRRGAVRVLLEVAETNPAALSLYARSGFRQLGRRPGYYAGPDGAGTVAALVLSRELTPAAAAGERR